jgi:hypothetical protein
MTNRMNTTTTATTIQDFRDSSFDDMRDIEDGMAVVGGARPTETDGTAGALAPRLAMPG